MTMPVSETVCCP